MFSSDRILTPLSKPATTEINASIVIQKIRATSVGSPVGVSNK